MSEKITKDAELYYFFLLKEHSLELRLIIKKRYILILYNVWYKKCLVLVQYQKMILDIRLSFLSYQKILLILILCDFCDQKYLLL